VTNATGNQSRPSSFRFVALHEAGHPAAALALGMLGPDGIRILSATDGCTSIDLRIEGLQDVQRIRDRATIAMAGLAADCIFREDFQSTHIDWQELWVKSPELQIDIAKAIRLSWIAVNHQVAWNQLIRPFLDAHENPKEDDILRMIAEHIRQHPDIDWDWVNPFQRAQTLIARCQCRRFIRQITEEFEEQTTLFISTKDCSKAWDRFKPMFAIRWVERLYEYFVPRNQP
jgi:hypothetical protein